MSPSSYLPSSSSMVCVRSVLMVALLVLAWPNMFANSQVSYSHSYASSQSSKSSSSTVQQGSDGIRYDSHASASRSENGVTFDYTYDNGRETLRVRGNPSSFDREAVLRSFRQSVGLDPDRFSENQDVNILMDAAYEDIKQDSSPGAFAHSYAHSRSESNPERKAEDEKDSGSIHLLSSFSNFLMSTSLGSNFQQLYDSITREETNEQLRQTKEDLNNIEEDLSKITTQQHILRTRQAELGSYLQQTQGKSCVERNPTIEELVHTEDDRLALLEHRLNRMKNKLLKQKNELLHYIQMHERNFQAPHTSEKTEGADDFSDDCKRKT